MSAITINNLDLYSKFLKPVLDFVKENPKAYKLKGKSLLGGLEIPHQLTFPNKYKLHWSNISIPFNKAHLDAFLQLPYKIQPVKNSFNVERRENFFDIYNLPLNTLVELFYQGIILDMHKKDAVYLKYAQFMWLFGNQRQMLDAEFVLEQYLLENLKDPKYKDINEAQKLTWVKDEHYLLLEKVEINPEWNILHWGKSKLEVQKPQYKALRTLIGDL